MTDRQKKKETNRQKDRQTESVSALCSYLPKDNKVSVKYDENAQTLFWTFLFQNVLVGPVKLVLTNSNFSPQKVYSFLLKLAISSSPNQVSSLSINVFEQFPLLKAVSQPFLLWVSSVSTLCVRRN